MALASEEASVPSRGGMQTARRYRFVSVALVAGLTGLIALAACSNNGEGERCEVLSANNGNDDCQDGLVCVPAADLNVGYDNARCCPVDRNTASHPACARPQPALPPVAPTPDSGPPVEASTGDAAEASTPVEAGPDADAATDAPDGD